MLTVEVVPLSGSLPALAAIAVPVFSGSEGPILAPGLPVTVGGAKLPDALDAALCERRGFGAKVGQTLVVGGDLSGPLLVLVGLGPSGALGPDQWRRAAATFVRAAGEGGVGAWCVPVVESAVDLLATLGEAIAEGAVLASYRFDEFRSRPGPAAIEKLIVVAEAPDELFEALARGSRGGHARRSAVAAARDLINTPPSELPPRRFAERIVELLRATEGVQVSSVGREPDRRGASRRSARGQPGLCRAAAAGARRLRPGGSNGGGRPHAPRRSGWQGHYVRLGRALAQDGRRHDDDED